MVRSADLVRGSLEPTTMCTVEIENTGPGEEKILFHPTNGLYMPITGENSDLMVKSRLSSGRERVSVN